MEQDKTQEVFMVEFKGTNYPCRRVEKQAGIIYAVKFETRILVLGKFISNNESFWTAIPEDTKLNHIVLELGAKIDTHYKNK